MIILVVVRRPDELVTFQAVSQSLSQCTAILAVLASDLCLNDYTGVPVCYIILGPVNPVGLPHIQWRI